MVGAGLALLALSSLGISRPVEDISHKAVAPVEGGLRALARPLANIVTNFGDIRALTRENEALRTQNERLVSDIARLREDSTRLEEYERLLEVKQGLTTHVFAAANVVARDPNNLRQAIAINRGRGDGLKTGMPVVTEGKTLVGTVTKVETDYAWVTLVTDVASAVSALVLESRAQGVVAGGYSRRLSMEFVAQDAVVKEGDTVVTSGLGGTYPPGLVIGRVTGVAGSRQEVFRTVTVEPLASLSRLETVLVMVSFTPVRVPAP